MGRSASFVTREEIRSARAASLYDYLSSNHSDLFRRSGRCLYMKDHDSVYIKDGFPGYNDFSTGSHGNPVDFLTRYLNYGFVEAVNALNYGGSVKDAWQGPGSFRRAAPERASGIVLPQPAPGPYRRMYAYLKGRGLPQWMIRHLEASGLAFQDNEHGNIVFVTPERDYCELRGTLTYADRPFHGCRKTSPDRFWYITTNRRTQKAYICESAIDAVSLLLLHMDAGKREGAAYLSIGGVCNQQAIDRIKRRITAVLAVDNDAAGNVCRERNPDLQYIIPENKDWNEDLQKSGITKGC